MPNKKRKEALDRRARQYASARLQDSCYPSGGTLMELTNAYERGYRDAMSDLRKQLTPSVSDGEDSQTIRQFLRPLR